MAHLIVTDFGAIKSANIEIKKYNFFIGHTSSGKSTIAKLLAIFNNSIFWTIKEGDFNSFLRLLDKYNINFEFTSTTIIRYSNEKYYWEIGLNKFHSNYEDADLMEMANTSKSYDWTIVPEIMIPLSSDVHELAYVKDIVVKEIEKVLKTS